MHFNTLKYKKIYKNIRKYKMTQKIYILTENKYLPIQISFMLQRTANPLVLLLRG